MQIRYRLAEEAPTLEIIRDKDSTLILIDPRLSILQIRASLIELASPCELLAYLAVASISMDFAHIASLLSLVS